MLDEFQKKCLAAHLHIDKIDKYSIIYHEKYNMIKISCYTSLDPPTGFCGGANQPLQELP
jgi:hypothetical protein